MLSHFGMHGEEVHNHKDQGLCEWEVQADSYAVFSLAWKRDVSMLRERFSLARILACLVKCYSGLKIQFVVGDLNGEIS